MSKVVAYILGTSKYPHRLEMLSSGGIRSKKHDLEVIVLGEGERPAVLKKDFTWMDWSNIRVADKHIYVLNQKKHPDADYYIFADDDSFTDIDKMVEFLDETNDIKNPCHWGGSPGFYCKPEHVEYIKNNFNFSEEKINNLRRTWVGFECTIMNRAFMQRAANSKESKIVKDTCSAILNNGDLSASITGGLIGSKGIISSGITQFKNILNYSGLVEKGSLFHVHYTTDNNILYREDLLNCLLNGPFERTKLISNLFKSKFHKTYLKPKNYVNRSFRIRYFWIYWTWGGWHSAADCSDSFCSKNIIMKRNGSIINSNGESTNLYWKQQKRGFDVYLNNNLWSKFYWSYNGMPVGLHNDIMWIME